MKRLLCFTLLLVFLMSCQNEVKKDKLNVSESVQNKDRVLSIDNLPTQRFIVDVSKDTILHGKKGTSIFLEKFTFVDSEGKVVKSQVDLELKEVLSASDMVLGNLTTTTNGKMLQSGGMVYLNAYSDNKQLFVSDSKSIGVSIPSNKVLNDMQIYSGAYDSINCEMNWVNPLRSILNNSFGNKSLQKGIKNNTGIPQAESPNKPLKYKESDDRVLSFVIEDSLLLPELKHYQNVRFRVADHCEYNPADAAINWYHVDLKKGASDADYVITFFGSSNHKKVVRKYDVSPVFEGKDYAVALAYYKLKYEQFEKKKNEIQEIELKEKERQKKVFEEQEKINFNEGSVNIFLEDPKAKYIFKTKRLGWLNVDRIYLDPRLEPVDLIVTIPNEKDKGTLYISMVFNNLKICLPGYMKKDKTIGFSVNDKVKTELPIGETAYVVVTSYVNDKTYCAINKITISENMTFSMQLEEVSTEDLKIKLETII